RGDAGIVDEHSDGLIMLQDSFHPSEIRCVAEVHRQWSDRAPGVARQTSGGRLEPRLVAGHQDEVVVPLCEAVCIDGADARGVAGDEGSALRGGIAHALLLHGVAARAYYARSTSSSIFVSSPP